jgi:hypothetical protein
MPDHANDEASAADQARGRTTACGEIEDWPVVADLPPPRMSSLTWGQPMITYPSAKQAFYGQTTLGGPGMLQQWDIRSA